MDKNKNEIERDIIDDDLYEDIDDEQMYELVQKARQQLLEKDKNEQPKKRKMFKWPFWIISIALVLNLLVALPQAFSIPAIEFLKISAKLSKDPDIKQYKKAVTVIETENSKGTGFSISEDGLIITNEHVVKDEKNVTVAFPNEGLFTGEVINTFPEVDLAVVKVESTIQFPFLTLADETTFVENESVKFIGNPLSFNGIANEGTIINYIQLKNWELPVLMLDAPVYRGNSGSP